MWRHGQYRDETLYLGGFEVWRRYEVNASVWTLEEERETVHVSDDARRICMIETETVSGGSPVSSPTPRLRFQLDDHLGTVAVEVDATGNVISYEQYHPYGTSAYRAQDGNLGVSAKRYRYNGKERDDETKLYYYGARYYAPWLGRWTAADPLAFADGVGAYTYVRGSPVVLSDPNGKQTPGGWTLDRYTRFAPKGEQPDRPSFRGASLYAHIQAQLEHQVSEALREAGYVSGPPSLPPEKPESSPGVPTRLDKIIEAAPRKAEKFVDTATGVGSGALKTAQGLAQAVDDPPAAGAAVADEFSRRQSQRGGVLGFVDALTMFSPFSQAVEGYREATVEAKEGNDVEAGESLFKFLLGAGAGASMVSTALGGGIIPPTALGGAEGGTWAGAGVGASEGTGVGLLLPGISMMTGEEGAGGSRTLTKEDLPGVDPNAIEKLEGSVADVGSTRSIVIEHVQAAEGSEHAIVRALHGEGIKSILEKAAAEGKSVVRFEYSPYNAKLDAFLSRRYNVSTVGGMRTFSLSTGR